MTSKKKTFSISNEVAGIFEIICEKNAYNQSKIIERLIEAFNLKQINNEVK